MTAGLQVGVGRSIITPPVGTILYGYAPGRPAESIHDDLRATCLAVADASSRALLISADICTYNEKNADRLRDLICSATDVPAQNILFCATHTHSGPATSAGAGWGKTNDAYIRDLLEPAVVRAAQTAVDSLQPALMGIGTATSQVAINRRQINRDGTVSLGQNPWGPYDPVMTVVSFKTKSGEPLANLIHYCCHGTAAGISPEATRDWSGPMVDCLEEQSGAVSVFFNGAEGDTGPRLPNGRTTGDLGMALDLGARAGYDAVRAWRKIRDYRDAAVGVISGDLNLPVKPLPDRATAEEAIRSLGDPEQLTGMRMREYDRWRRVIQEHDRGGELKQHRTLKQTIIAVGPLAFVPFPYEMFVEITLRIRQFSPFQHTLCLSNTNGSYGYFPTRDQFARGGYEVAISRIFDTYEQTETADDAAVEQNLKMLEALAEKLLS